MSLADTSPWWLLPNLFALDAPVVAIVWQRFLAGRFDVDVPWVASAALGAAVWSIYLIDRRLDAARGCLDADRHRAAARRPRLFLGAGLLAACLSVFAAAWLPAGYILAGLVVGLGVAAYLGLIHIAGGSLHSHAGVKELLVAIGFAGGVAIPLPVNGPPPVQWVPGIAAFAGLCFLNCRLIDRWESGGPRRAWPEFILGVGLLAFCVALPLAIGLAVGGASLSLLVTRLTCRRRLRVARVLADAVLLTPLACCVVP
ncbi:hypothetical protein [Zavarzinella formosa]|uniref:hypothetical protein n=1 Tax=Zavarzinella formosa TaxID=360055 RepID=UPI00031CD160|nr:hypothetical protein [Zavarzinella formosa]